MARPFDEGNSPESCAQEHTQSNLGNCTASSPERYPPRAHLLRGQGEYCDHSATVPSFRRLITCGMNSTTNSSLPGEVQRIQLTMLDAGMNSPAVDQGNSFHHETGNDEAIMQQIGIQLRLMGDQLHSSHLEQAVEWDRRHWPVWYWTFLNFFTHALAIFRVPRWR